MVFCSPSRRGYTRGERDERAEFLTPNRRARKNLPRRVNNWCTPGEFVLPSPNARTRRIRSGDVESAIGHFAVHNHPARVDRTARSALAAGHRHPDRHRGRRRGSGHSQGSAGVRMVGGAGHRLRRQRRAPKLRRNDLDRHRGPDDAAGGIRQVRGLLGPAPGLRERPRRQRRRLDQRGGDAAHRGPRCRMVPLCCRRRRRPCRPHRNIGVAAYLADRCVDRSVAHRSRAPLPELLPSMRRGESRRSARSASWGIRRPRPPPRAGASSGRWSTSARVESPGGSPGATGC